VIAPSFGDIFRTNAVNTGLAPIVVPPDQLSQLREAKELTVDLVRLEIRNDNGLRIPFELDAHTQETLVHGLDDIARTLTREPEIDAYEATHAARFDTRALPA
jgi:3-isopropylmalate dehydratase small subunit